MEALFAKLGIQIDIYRTLAVFGLILARMLGAVFQAPFIGGKMVPSRAKIGTAVVLAIPMYFTIAETVPNLPYMGPMLIILLLKEGFIGLVLGLVISLVFHAVDSGGRFLDNARGLGSATLVAPETGASVSLFGQFFFQMTVVIYLIIGGHRLFIEALYETYTLLPIDQFPNFAPGFTPFTEWIVRATADVLVICVKIVAPGIIATIITDLVMGITNRVSPQINVFSLSMPIKMLVGALMIFLVLGLIVRSLDDQLLSFTQSIKTL